jgi:Tfp pilus assembly protein PilE
MRTVVVACAIIAILAGPAYSQGHRKGGKRAASSDQQSEQQKKKASAAEKDYKAALDKIPDKKFDPWGNVR